MNNDRPSSPGEHPGLVEMSTRQALCPGCGVSLPLVDCQGIVTCMYCGSMTKVERRIRTLEPVIPQVPAPEMPRDPTKAYDEWGTARLVAGIMRHEEPVDERVAMAGALDEWFHVSDEMASYVFALVEFMAGAPRELDMALSGILGKMICSDTLSYRQVIMAAGERFGFRNSRSLGLVDALSLGDGATVGLLMDIAQWGAEQGDEEYSDAALMAAQTAIGREQVQRGACMEILLYRFLYARPRIQEWIAHYLRCHFDVGYTDLFAPVLRLIDDCVAEAPSLIPPLKKALEKCWRAENGGEYGERCAALKSLRSLEAKGAGCRALGYPPPGMGKEEACHCIQVLRSLTEENGLKEEAGWVINQLENVAGAP